MIEVGRHLWNLSHPAPPAQSRVSHSKLLRAMLNWILNTSEDGDSTVSLGTLLQCSATPTGKSFFLHINVIPCLYSLFSWIPKRRV